MEIVRKPACEYGANCYRKNPNHFKEYAHPHDKAVEAKKKIDKKEPVLKKPKLDIVKEKVERPIFKKEPVKQSAKTPDSAKKMKQTTLNFFKKDVDVNKKSPEVVRRSPRKHSTENKNQVSAENVKVQTSPKKINFENKGREELKKSPNLKKQKTPEKKKSPQKKVKPEEKDTKVRTKVDFISDSDDDDDDTSEMLKKMDELEKVEAAQNQKKKSPQKNLKSPRKSENAKKVRPNMDYISDSDDEVKSEAKPESKLTIQESDKSKIDKKTIIEESDNEEDDDGASAPSPSWTYIKIEPDKVAEDASKNKEDSSVEGIIKNLFLVDMPQDFYNFFDFCKSLNNTQPQKALMVCGLKLVGPFDIVAGNKRLVGRDNAVCHWRYFYDPPEFQTVLSGEKGFHMGYWRDDPKESPVFVASNNADKDCVFKIEAENIFGALNSYLNDYVKSCDPFTKLKIPKLQSSLSEWAEKNNITLEKMTENMRKRQKKVVSKTLHRAGIVVPVEPKTELGYRPLIETEANLKKICKLIMNSKDDAERDTLWDNLQPLITAANIANDECDFGNSLELGIDLFCMGSSVFHDTIGYLLSTSYSLLNRDEFAEIIQKHLKNRRKGFNLSIV